MSSSAEKPIESWFRETLPPTWARVRSHLHWLPWMRRTTIGAAAFIALYLFAGFFILPAVIRWQATDWVKTNLGKTIAIGKIGFNPINFAVDANDIAIPASPRPMVSIGHLHIRFAVLSFLGSTYDFYRIRIDKPYVFAHVRPDGVLNLIELLPKKKSSGPNPDVWIGKFSIDQGKVFYDDDSRPRGLEETLLPVSFTLKNFQTNRATGGAFQFHAVTARKETFDWTGTISIDPVDSEGHLIVGNLLSDTVQRLAGAASPVALTSGAIGLSANYHASFRNNVARLDLAVPNLELTGFGLAPKSSVFAGTIRFGGLKASVSRVSFSEKAGKIQVLNAVLPRLSLHALEISPIAISGRAIRAQNVELANAALDYGARKFDLGSLSLAGADLSIHRDGSGKIDLLSLLPAESANSTLPTAPAAPAQQWRTSLGTFRLSNASLQFDDEAVTPAAHLMLGAIDATATDLGTDTSSQSRIRFDARINDAASIAINGTAMPASEAADLTFTLTSLPLPALAGYVAHNPNLVLKSGTASASGTLHLRGEDISALAFSGDATLDDLDLRERTTDGSLFAWHSFALKGIDVGSNRVEIASATLTRPFGRVAILPNSTFNYVALMSPTGAPVTVAHAPANAGPAKPPMKFALDRLNIARGTMGFTDYSIQPNFNARIDALVGTITNISTSPRAISAIDLKGHVIDRYSPVTIKGTVNLLSYDRQTDMHLAFRNIELPIFNPYSDRYAGYAIAKGKLTTEFKYKIQNRTLKADHHIIVDQLEWGQATATKQAVPFPIRLATALLKDSNGVIDLDVPVTGSLDDPQFRLGPIIWQIIGNTLEKAATAPFRLIGSLFSGADKAQFVDFAPGSSRLPSDAPDALTALAKALVQRPALKLDIPAGAGPGDADGLADSRIDALLMAKEAKNGLPTDVATLDAGERHDRLENLYSNQFDKSPDYPEFSPDALKVVQTDNPGLGDDGARTILQTRWLRSQLRTKFAPQPADLEALGKARATAIRNALLANTTIDPARIFIAAEATAAAVEHKSRVELKFE